MAFNSKDLMVSLLPSPNAEGTCPELTIPTACQPVSSGLEVVESEGLALLRRQLRTVLSLSPG